MTSLQHKIGKKAFSNFNKMPTDLHIYFKDSSHLILHHIRIMPYKVGLTKMLWKVIVLVNLSL